MLGSLFFLIELTWLDFYRGENKLKNSLILSLLRVKWNEISKT